MPDILSPIERQLIADALAAGRVTQVPRGVSGVPIEGVSWRDRGPAQARQMKRVDRLAKAKALEEVPAQVAPVKASRVKPPVPVDRQTDKRVLAAQGRLAAAKAFAQETRTVKEMAKHLDMTEDYTWRYCRKHGIPIQPALRSPERQAATAKRDAQIRELAAAGHSGREIAVALGVTRFAIYARAAALKVKLQGRSARPEKPKSRTVAPRVEPVDRRKEALDARRAQVAKLVADGLTSDQIAKQLGARRELIWRDCRELGLKPVSSHPYAKGPSAETLARWERVKVLAAEGLCAGEIADRLSIRPALVRLDAKRAGIVLSKPQPAWAANGTEAARLGRTMKVNARRDVLRRIFRPEMTRQELLAAMLGEGFSVKIGSLEADLIALDLRVSRKGKVCKQDRVDLARGEIVSLHGTGLSPVTVARRVGLSIKRVLQVLSEDGRHAA